MTATGITQPGISPPISEWPKSLPDHTQLPESDGTFVLAERAEGKNFQEHPQSLLLTDSITPILENLHPDGQYCIGQDSGIYWRLTDPPQKGAEAPDWFYVPNVPPTLNDTAAETVRERMRRSYVMWQEIVSPLIVLEFVSGNGDEERDATPYQGKFWVYEQALHVPFYGIYEESEARVEVYHLVDGCYQLLPANSRGHYPIEPLGIELGIWRGRYQNAMLPWLRWWDASGNLLLTGAERAETERQRAETERQRAETERQRAETERQRAENAESLLEQERLRAEALAQRLRDLGIDL